MKSSGDGVGINSAGSLEPRRIDKKMKAACTLIVMLMLAGCRVNDQEELLILGNRLFCVDGCEEQGIFYKEIHSFAVSETGEIFIANLKSSRIDAYDRQGAYRYSIGGRGEGPGEFPAGIGVFTCAKDRIIVYDFSGKIIVFDNTGKLANEKKFSDIGISGHVFKILAFADKLILYLLDNDTYRIALLKSDLEMDRLIATPIRDRRMPVHFRSDIDIDDHGCLYVTDNYDYAIQVYDLKGKNIQSFKREVKKNKFRKKDFVVFSDHEIYRHPASERLKELESMDKYWPSLCGIHVDKRRIYIWRTDLSEDGECLVDVYDDQWHYLHGFHCGNGLAVNVNSIVNGKLYVLAAKEPYPSAMVRQLGKFGKMSMPDHVCVYPVPE